MGKGGKKKLCNEDERVRKKCDDKPDTHIDEFVKRVKGREEVKKESYRV